MRADCYFCHIKTIKHLVDKFQPENGLAEDFIFSVHNFISENRKLTNPVLATYIHRIAKEKLGVSDLYAEEKNKANNTLLDQYESWRDFIDKSEDPFRMAVKLAVTGNIVDYGAHSLKGDLVKQIKLLAQNPLAVDYSGDLKKALENAASVLYLGDNAGEIFFDRLLIETIAHPNITFVTRGAPVINDVTEEDAKMVGIDNYCSLITNGSDAPSTILEWCSEEFLESYNNADLIISKGQGNFEGLMNEGHKNTFFLLIAKCEPIAELIGCKKNDLLVTKLD